MKNPRPSNNPPAVSAWSPLRQGLFRSIWIATVVSNVGTWMQSVGVAWLMTSLTPSPLLVALMQTAASLPIFILGLPAGTFADLINRRKLLLATESLNLIRPQHNHTCRRILEVRKMRLQYRRYNLLIEKLV